MKISHKYNYINSEELLYIYIAIEDNNEFSDENLNSDKSSSLLFNLKKYIKKNINKKRTKVAIIVINGVILGTISLHPLFSSKIKINKAENITSPNKIEIYKENSILNKSTDILDEQNEEIKADIKVETRDNTSISKSSTTSSKSSKKPSNKVIEITSKYTTGTNKTTLNTSSSSSKTVSQSTTKVATSKSVEKKVPTISNPTPTTNTEKKTKTTETTSKKGTSTAINSDNTKTTNTSIKNTIKLSTNGNVVTMDLEEYIIGVVSAEMPASFHIEALKSQAIAARTFAMKKASQGITLVNSTSHQVYKNESQLKALWGKSYSTYYAKVKNAVYSTKGMILMYNGKYIDAVYHSMSNGRTELPSYVWSYSYPYLKCVSSSWDNSVSSFKVSTNMNYDNISSKLGIDVSVNTDFEILSYTESGRVEKIKVGNTTFTGVKFRNLLGLRSTDITIVKNDKFVTFITKGYGHGVGMSQYGANGAAKEGYSYIKILKHYYPGITIVTK